MGARYPLRWDADGALRYRGPPAQSSRTPLQGSQPRRLVQPQSTDSTPAAAPSRPSPRPTRYWAEMKTRQLRARVWTCACTAGSRPLEMVDKAINEMTGAMVQADPLGGLRRLSSQKRMRGRNETLRTSAEAKQTHRSPRLSLRPCAVGTASEDESPSLGKWGGTREDEALRG